MVHYSFPCSSSPGYGSGSLSIPINSSKLLAINDTTDKGNRLDLKIEIFKKDERIHKRENIYCFSILEQSKQVIKEEIKEYFNTHHPDISWNDFWLMCELEL